MSSGADPHDECGMIEAAASTEQVRNVYDLWSSTYDLIAGPFERAARRAAVEKAAIQPTDAVLEVAVGTGETFLEVVTRGGPSSIAWGVDLSSRMLARTRSRLNRVDRSNWALCRADARQLPFADGAFDVVLNDYMLDLIPLADLPIVMHEFFRLLRPSGRMVLVNFSKADASKRTWWERMYRRMPKRCAAYLLGGCRPVVMAPLAEQAGFRDVSREFRPSLFLPTEIVVARKT